MLFSPLIFKTVYIHLLPITPGIVSIGNLQSAIPMYHLLTLGPLSAKILAMAVNAQDDSDSFLGFIFWL